MDIFIIIMAGASVLTIVFLFTAIVIWLRNPSHDDTASRVLVIENTLRDIQNDLKEIKDKLGVVKDEPK